MGHGTSLARPVSPPATVLLLWAPPNPRNLGETPKISDLPYVRALKKVEKIHFFHKKFFFFRLPPAKPLPISRCDPQNRRLQNSPSPARIANFASSRACKFRSFLEPGGGCRHPDRTKPSPWPPWATFSPPLPYWPPQNGRMGSRSKFGILRFSHAGGAPPWADRLQKSGCNSKTVKELD